MTKEQIKLLVREKLHSKRIILFGAGIVAEEFYQEYKDCLQISHCISNLSKEWGEKTFLGELDVRQYKQEELQENDYLVVCGPIAFRSIELQLEAAGMKMYENYVESKIASVILQNKKIALFYGQCILRDMYHCIVQIPMFQSEYASIYTQVVPGQAIVTNRLLYYAKELCDLYVYTPKILDHDSVYVVKRNELPADCQIISISNLVVSLYWPQVSPKLRDYNEYYLYPYNIKRDVIFGHTLYRRQDRNINKMVLENLPTKEIVERLSDEDYYSEKQILKNRNIFLKSIALAEKGVDITILDYIRDNYESVPLYQNFVHSNACIILEYIRRLLQKLELPITELNSLEEKLPELMHHGGDVPIYPSVIKHLKLKFANAETKYEVMIGNGIVSMTFREYMEHFTEYTRKTIEVSRML